jgi:putative ABC transport system substrate-binding protein
VPAGGLISYGPNLIDQFREVAGYVDRILRGEKPADMPVQARQNMSLRQPDDRQGARLKIAPTLLAPADEVIE